MEWSRSVPYVPIRVLTHIDFRLGLIDRYLIFMQIWWLKMIFLLEIKLQIGSTCIQQTIGINTVDLGVHSLLLVFHY